MRASHYSDASGSTWGQELWPELAVVPTTRGRKTEPEGIEIRTPALPSVRCRWVPTRMTAWTRDRYPGRGFPAAAGRQ